MALMTHSYVALVLTVVRAATFVNMVSVAVTSLMSLSPKMVYMLFCGTYSIWPAVLRSCCAKMRRMNALAMKVLSAVYVFGVIASQLSNYFKGEMLACINKRTALLMICMSEYGSRART